VPIGRFLSRLFNYAGWPTLTGLLLGAVVILLLPHYNNSQPGLPSLNDLSLGNLSPRNQWEGRVSYADAVRQAAPAVVNIYTRKKLKRRRHPLFDDPLFRHFFNNSNLPQQERMQSALGSGVIIKEEGYILTNNHVIDGADEIVVLTRDGREAQARLVGTDPESDLAVLKIELDNLSSITIGNPDTARIGDVVLAIGNPFGVGQTVTQGIISATGRFGLNLNTYEDFLQTDAAINPGNSGGALIDAYGNLLGINTAIYDQTGFSVGIGFAIPADTALQVMKDLVEHGQVIRGWLGIEAQQLSPQLAKSFNIKVTNGVVVTAIYNNGPAHRAGLRPGDVITHINNQPIGDGRRGMNQIAYTRPGTQVSVYVLRNGEPQTIVATIGSKPSAS
jgi:serine protease DegS